MSDYPSVQQIEEFINHGSSYSKAIDQDEIGYNKYINFKIKPMSKKLQINTLKEEHPQFEDLTEENFEWHNKDKSSKLHEMDGDYLLAAMTHCTKLANANFVKAEEARKRFQKFQNKTGYFMKMFQIMEAEFHKRYQVEVPYEPEDIRSMRKFIKDGILKITDFPNVETAHTRALQAKSA